MRLLADRHMTIRPAITMLLAVVMVCGVLAQEQADTMKYRYIPLSQDEINDLIPDELRNTRKDTAVQMEMPGPFTAMLSRNTKFLRYLDRLATGNKDRSFEKRFDVNFIVMPSYTREGSFGIGGGITGLYRLDRNDSIMQPSDITLIGNATLNGFFALTASGNTHFPGRRLRYSHKLEYTYSPLDFWGISRDACGRNAQIGYTRNQLKYTSDLMYRATGRFNIGALFDLIYAGITNIDDVNYLEGQGKSYFFTGLGVVLQYDTRDFILQPRRGVNLLLRMGVRPQIFGTFDRTLFNVSFTGNYYQPLWSGSVLATDVYASFNSVQSPWPLREALGSGGIRMRGYYAGRYMDNNLSSIQVELRQHLFSRFGVALWGGIGNVFTSPRHFRGKDLLVNGGVGLRVELKHNVNGRIDFGLGRNTCGFVFAIGEAF